MQMDRQSENDRLQRERLDKHDQWMMEDRKDARDLQKLQFQQALSDKQRAQMKDAADATSQAALGVLGVPEADRPAAYQTALTFLKSRGLPTDNLPPQYSPGMDGMLRFYVQRAESAHEYLKREGGMPQAMSPPGGAPAAAPSAGGAPGDVMARAGNAIGGIESGGKYDALGPMTGGDRAYGKYQVMGANVPSWTAEVLGKPMTPQEFVANPQAQDAVFKAKFGQYVQKYGPEGASRAWFAGEGGMNNPNAKDVLGTSVADYGRKFNAGFGGPQVADAGGFTPTNTPAQSIPGGLPQVAQGDAIAGQGDVMAPPRTAPTTIGSEVEAIRKQTRANGGDLYTVNGQPEIKDGHYVIRSMQDKRTVVGMIPVKPQEVPFGWEKTPDGRIVGSTGGPHDPARENDKVARDAAKQNAEQANKLRDDFRQEPDVKRYRVVVPMLESAKDAASRPTRAADINLVYAFAKLMDPESVVRESEVGMVTATGTVADKLEGLLSQLNGGQMLTPETRAKLIAELESRFKSTEASYNEIANAYGEIADSNGIKRSHVVLPIRGAKKSEEKGAAAPTAAPKPGDVVDGYIFNGGDPSQQSNWRKQ